MASLKLVFVCCLALVAASFVDACPAKCKKSCNKPCPDTTIGCYFDEISITVCADFDWIAQLIKLIESQKGCDEYAVIIELWAELQQTRDLFDNSFNDIQGDIYDRIIGCRDKYSPFSINYTERAVVLKKLARRGLWPSVSKFRSCYNRILPLIEELIAKNNIDCQPRAVSCPRPERYNFISYFPKSKYCNDIALLIQTCYKDYSYINDLIKNINFPDDCDLKQKCTDDILNAWIDFIKYARELEVSYYPRLMECGDNADQLDVIYLEYLNKLRSCAFDFGSTFYDQWGLLDDYCNDNNLPWYGYLDYDTRHPQDCIRGSYVYSPKLNDHFSKYFVTCRSDYMTELRIWNDLQCKKGTPEWNRRDQMCEELKRRLCELERWLNRYIRDCMKRLRECDRGTDIDFDVQYEDLINDMIADCDKQIFPYIIDFRECFFNSDDCIDELLKQRGLDGDCTRNIISCSNNKYDISLYIPDKDLCDLIKWFENCLRENFYVPINDLIQIRFPEDCEEYRLRKKALGELECIWKDYRNCLKTILRQFIDLLKKEKCEIGTPKYRREVKRINESFRPRIIDIIDKCKKICADINDILENLYKKKSCNKNTCKDKCKDKSKDKCKTKCKDECKDKSNNKCKRKYFFSESSFEVSISARAVIKKNC